ncbi:MAG: restriction endonuclease subunit S, partial [Porticoccaceae bacterium]
QGAYKQLRKLLVEDYLIAVVSLPAGVFQPYSGVKTSILILDKSLARTSDSIAFVKVQNDGFGLGAQRRAIASNDLPAAAAALQAFRHSRPSGNPGDAANQTSGHSRVSENPGDPASQTVGHSRASGNPVDFDPSQYPGLLLVEKSRIAANGDYNLSGERYREGAVVVSSYPFVPVGDVFRKADKTVLPDSLDGPVTYLGLENITQGTGKIEGDVVTENPADIKSLKNVFKPGDILYGKLRPNLNKVWLADRTGICSTDIFVIEAIEERTVPAFCAYLFRSARFNDAVMGQLKGAQLPRIGWTSFAELQIPLPPLEVQKEIVADIEGYQKVIDGARAVLDHYRPHIPIHPDWPMVEIGMISTIVRGSSPRPQGDPNFFGGPVPRLMVADITRDGMYATPQIDSLTELGATKSRPMKKGEVIITVSGNPGLPTILAIDACIHDGFVGLRELNSDVRPEYLYFALLALHASHGSQSVGSVFRNLTTDQIREFKIALPPLAIQQAIVAEIEAEQALVNANRELIARFEQKIQATLARVWGEEVEPADSCKKMNGNAGEMPR